ncbi:unnamed protein product [Clonostachys solani]|uniref:FAD/NAD(P)-binding domain-containing protein n=1 Tax=Clonostachys solani TaxID=160281 RepID=A0A9P0EPR1_9HYPO|nr:unnamed protein product [Clonostachys solani]
MTVGPKTVVVLGGSFVGLSAVRELLARLPSTHRVLLIEPHSHLHYLFPFPRYAILPGHEHKAFVPYTGTFSEASDPSQHAVVQARAVSLTANQVVLDREWRGSNVISFDYAIIATGTRLSPPGSVEHDEKPQGIEYFKYHQDLVKKADSVVLIGGGAVGVQMATDMKEIYPEKKVTLIHSRDLLMQVYHHKLDEVIRDRFKELDIDVITGTRAVIPPKGFPSDGSLFALELKDGRKIPTNLVILATGQTANSQFLKDLEPSTSTSILNPNNGFIRVLPTLQLQDPKYSNIFAVGDVADTGARKAARPGVEQAAAAVANIASMIAGKEPSEQMVLGRLAIHLTLGLHKNIVFFNPDKGKTEAEVMWRDDGLADMGIGAYKVWEGRGVSVTKEDDYYL